MTGCANFALLYLLSLLVFFACRPSANEGIILKLNNGTEPQTLDPAIATGHPEFRVSMALFEGLTVYDPKDLSPRPGVAERWNVSGNGLNYTFYLRKNAKWSDGTPIEAETFRYSWLRALAPETASEYAYQLWYIKNAEKYTKNQCKADAVGIKATDKYTLRVTLESPTPFFISLTSFHTYMPTPKHIIDKYGTDKWIKPEYFSGNGPFALKEWRPKNYIKMIKSQTYWDKEKVRIDTVYFYPYEDASSGLEMFLNGELDWIDTVPSEQMDQMSKKAEFHKAPHLALYYYNINIKSIKSLSDKRIRKALYLTVDRNLICKFIGKAGQIPAYGLVPLNMPGYSGYEGEKENPAKARKLLAEAGYPGGKNFPQLTILYNTLEDHKKIAEAIQQMWKKELNIDAVLENQEWKVFLQKTQSKDYQIARSGWTGDYVDPNTFLDMFVTGGGNNHTNWSNTMYDEFIRQAKYEQNPAARMRIFREAEKLFMDELPIIPIYYYVRVQMIKQYVKGVYDNILDLHPLKDVYIDSAERMKYNLTH